MTSAVIVKYLKLKYMQSDSNVKLRQALKLSEDAFLCSSDLAGPCQMSTV